MPLIPKIQVFEFVRYAPPYRSLILLLRETAMIFHKAVVGSSVYMYQWTVQEYSENQVLLCCYLLFAFCAAQFLVCGSFMVAVRKISDRCRAKYSKHLL